MFGPLGFWEILFIVVLALLIFGPKKLPEVGRTVGKGMAEFRKATSDLKRTIEHEITVEETAGTLDSATIEGPRPVESAASRTVERSGHRDPGDSAADAGSSSAGSSSPDGVEPAAAD